MAQKVFRQYRQRSRETVRRAGEVTPSADAVRAQNDFPFFCAYLTRNSPDPKVQPPHMTEWNQQLLTGKSSRALDGIAGPNVDILAPRGSAKAQPLDEPVLTPDGFVPMGTLQVGDRVITADGSTATITRITPQGIKDNYKVTFTDRAFTYCSDDHLWHVRNIAGGDRFEYKTLTLNHIRTKIFVSTSGSRKSQVKTIYREAEKGETPWLDRRGYAKYHIPVVLPVDFEEKEYIVDPYLLGVLIGDGNLTNSSICFSTGDLEQIDLLRPLIPCDQEIKPHGNHPSNYMISRSSFKGSKLVNPLISELKHLGLWGKRAEAKFIPDTYLRGSVRQRQSLLQGLLDTDGTVADRGSNSGGGVSFCTTSERLRDDIVLLVQSLGGIATVNKPQNNSYQVGEEKKRGRTSYKIGIKFGEGIQPFRLSRKASKYKPCKKLKPTRGIVDIQHVGTAEMQCITIDHPSQLYITRDYIVTHNSTYLGMFAAWSIGRHAMLKRLLQILYISYTVDVARPKSSAIKSIIESPEYREIFPTVIPGRKWSDEYWCIDLEFAGISIVGQEAFSICCAGLKGAIVSKRSHLILLDDLVKSEFDIANPEIREQMEQNWTRSILPTMFDGGRAICLGTRFRADDIHCSTFTPENGWIQIEQSAIIDDDDSEGGEKSYWDFWSLEHLQSIRALDPIGFSFQYQNKIVRTTEVSIHPDWIIKSPVHRDIRRYEQIGIGVDLSSKTKERHDFTVMVLGGRLNNRYYILDMWRGRVAGNKSKLEHLLELCYAWDIIDSSGKYYLGTDINCYLYVEDVAYQASLKGDFQTYVINELSIHNLIYRPIFAKGDKLSKLRSVTGLFENELVRFNDQAKLGAAIEELVSFGATAHDDCADAIELLLNGLRSSAPLEVLYG